MSDAQDVQRLEARIVALEARVAALEGGRRQRSAPAGGAGAPELDVRGWTQLYVVAQLEVAETWIELHEPSARPQLQRLVREVVDVEGPVTDRLLLDRIRRAWGLKRAGGRVQEAVDQAVRQLLARGLVERTLDALVVPGRTVEQVRIPGDDEASRRGAEDVPVMELASALREVLRSAGGLLRDDATMGVARTFGWTRRGGAIQERLDAAVDAAERSGWIVVAGDRLEPVSRAATSAVR